MSWDTETLLFYGLIILLITAIVVIILLLIHSGFFTEINVQTCKPCIGEIKIAYKFARGPYKESGALFTEAHSILPKYRTVGVYYDDPKKNEQSRLRYIVGLIISENGEAVNEADEQTLKDYDYKFATFPAINHAVQTEFPFQSTLSIIVAIFRVYPIVDEYIEVRSLCVHPFIEIYDNKRQKIFFVGPLERQDSFYVPEVLEPEELTQGEEENTEEEYEKDERSTVSWEDSASYIKSDILDGDSLVDEAPSLSADNETGSVNKGGKETQKDNEDASVVSRSPLDEDSDNNTASSFEEIDEKEAPELMKDDEDKENKDGNKENEEKEEEEKEEKTQL